MNILVTGATGFIGRRLVPRLEALGHHVSYFQKDITKPFSLGQPFDLTIHLAAYNITNVGPQDTDLYTAVNVEGTRNLLQNIHTDRFIYLSTAKLYKNEGKPLTEDSVLAPQGAYAQSKWEAEKICLGLLPAESLVILRCANVIGWGQAPKAVVPVFFQKAKSNQPLNIMGGPRTLMQFVYVEDLIDAIQVVIERTQAQGVYNIAHEDAVSLEQLARIIITQTGSSSVVNVAGNTAPAFAPVVCIKARQELGWKAFTGLSRILELYGQAYAKTA